MGNGNNGRLALSHRRIMVLEDDLLVKNSLETARELSRRSGPFLFYSRQPDEVLAPIRAEWPDNLFLAKPTLPDAILQEVVGLLAAAETGHARFTKRGGLAR